MMRMPICFFCGVEHRKLSPNGRVYSGIHGFKGGRGMMLGFSMGTVKDDDHDEFFLTVQEIQSQAREETP